MIGVSSLTATQQVVAIAAAAALLVVVLVLVYRGRLREDYAALWLVVAVVALVLAIWQEGLRAIARLFDSVTLTAPVFLLAIAFLTLIALRFTVRLSEHDRKLKRLAQDVALLSAARPAASGDRPAEPVDRTPG